MESSMFKRSAPMVLESAFANRYGRWALITGAAQGLGAEFARRCAAAGLDLVLVDRLERELQRVSESLSTEYGISTRSIVLDLARVDCLEVVLSEVRDLEIGLLVSNAASSHIGTFLERTRASLLEELGVNMRAPLLLAHHFGNTMAKRGRGGIILVSSLSAVTGSAQVAHYAATKAYTRILAESLWQELKPRGVDTLTIVPGMTATPGWFAADPSSDTPGRVMTPEEVVNEGLAALGKRPSRITGLNNRISAALLERLLPRRWSAKLVSDATSKLFERSRPAK